MVCPYCESQTKVVNSRRQVRNNQIWRRRQCLTCKSVFTTHEAVELESVLLVESDGQLNPFLADSLLKELMLALAHRKDVYTASREVLGTIIKRLLALPSKPVIKASDIAKFTAETLKRFDRPAYLRYLADHPSVDN